MTDIEYTDSIKLYEHRVYGFIFKQTKNGDLSKEIVQEAFMKLWINKSTVEALKTKSWLFTTAYNHMINMLKKESRYVRRVSEKPDNDIDYNGSSHYTSKIEQASNLDTTNDFDRKEIIQSELKKLPIRDRRLIILRDMHGFSYSEIAERMNLNETQVKVYLFRVRKVLKDKFKSLNR